MGWGLSRDAWGKGYATEGAAACMDYAFDVLGWTEATATAVADLEPEGDIHATAEYRLHLARVLTARALATAWSAPAATGTEAA